MPYYKAQHETFIRALIRHGDQLLAYRQAYPKASKESAYSAAIRLMRRPQIRERVQAAMYAHKERERERERGRGERERRMVEEDVLRRRIWLAKVVRGEVERKRYFQVRGQAVLVYDTLSPFITLAAIELDCKYEYGYSPKILLDRQFDRLYARANRVVGQALINRTFPSRSDKRNSPWKVADADPSAGDVAQRQGDVHEKKVKSPGKKLTDSSQNPHQSTPPASNKNDICNKIKTVKTAILKPASAVWREKLFSSRPIRKTSMNEIKIT